VIRYYLDENLSSEIAVLVRKCGFAALCSHECGNDQMTDAEQLAFAATRGYCMVTNDHEDFIGLAEEYAASGRTHAGILLLSRPLPPEAANFDRIARALAHYAELYPDGIQHIDWLRPVTEHDG
jgi:predicted nuclease of predicted toxin-antitoxin system